MAKRRLTLVEVLAACTLVIMLVPVFVPQFLRSSAHVRFSRACTRCHLLVRTAILSSLSESFPVRLSIDRIKGSYILSLTPHMEGGFSSRALFSKDYPLTGVSDVLVKEGRKERAVEQIEIVFPDFFHTRKKVDALVLQQGDSRVEISLEP
ncbi:hypothetical protein [Candidatus Similichlamydia laticola]|uniref:Uncharacterized protein n=1 Tax=Candidatus Similichlamydia laticola TaxID=2170265 RepID=A0A369KHA3_9BACT|nr:hypothetical protein [Candidatus Similichlamydia laticola]RDB31173.1 hypothetical protein HAT2_00725 [Candidatus Similichlamydia laticola]